MPNGHACAPSSQLGPFLPAVSVLLFASASMPAARPARHGPLDPFILLLLLLLHTLIALSARFSENMSLPSFPVCIPPLSPRILRFMLALGGERVRRRGRRRR